MSIHLYIYVYKHWLYIHVSDMCVSMYECISVYVYVLCVCELCESMYMFLGMCLSVFICRECVSFCSLWRLSVKHSMFSLQKPILLHGLHAHGTCSIHGPLEKGLLNWCSEILCGLVWMTLLEFPESGSGNAFKCHRKVRGGSKNQIRKIHG